MRVGGLELQADLGAASLGVAELDAAGEGEHQRQPDPADRIL